MSEENVGYTNLNSQKDFELEINIWGFQPTTGQCVYFMYTYLFANLNELYSSMVLNSRGTRDHGVKGRCPQLSS